MATLDDSPSLFSGQQWTDWAESVLPDIEPDEANCDTAEDNTDTDSMKLRIEDMPLFGVCPSRDEFYLVVCDKCNQVLKPQAFQAHLEIRHGGKGGYSASSIKAHQSSSRHSVSSKSHSKSHSSSKPHRSSHSKSHSSPNKSSHRSHSHSRLKAPPLEEVNSGQDSLSHVIPETIDVFEDVKPELLTETSVIEPSQSLDTAAMVGADTGTESVKDSKIKNTNSGLPVVKVERIPDTLAMKKHRDSTGSARTSPLTNGSLRGSKSPPLAMPVITDSDEDVKSSSSSMPVLKSSQDTEDLYLEDMDTVPVSEINDAVSSILEPVSPVSETETSGFVALATSSSTITTDTVTMATITTSTTTVTNVINTNSSFTFGSMGRPSFPMGSIRVNFSSTGVLNSITGDGNSNNNNSNNNNNNSNNNNSTVLTKTSTVTVSSEPSKASICSNGSMESTISDIVKSAVNSGNTGGFKSLSPLLTSPNKSNSIGNTNSSFKSPTKLGNLVKSSSSSSLQKSSSKLNSGLSNVFKSSSTGSVATTSGSSSSGTSSTVNTEAIKKFQLLNKPDKIIPLKDREYDPNKHCGVVVAETGKPCTRSLTCKSHALSLRRAVHGRRLPFDDLLKEHREAKEAYQKAKVESKEAAAALKACQAASKGQVTHIVTPHGKLHNLTTIASPVVKSNSHLNPTLNKENKTLPGSVFPVAKPLTLQKPASISSQRLSLSSIGSPSSNDELQSPTGKPADKLISDDADDNSFTSYHPRPIAACSFGARYHNSYGSGLNNYGSGFGCYTFGRKMDHLRSTFLDLLEKHSNPPPPKKLCVEANLPREQDNMQGNIDPYDFVLVDPSRNHLSQHIIQGPAGLVSSVPNKVVTKQQKTKIVGNTSNHSTFSGSKPKLKDSFLLSKSVSLTGNVTPGLLTSTTAAKKRRSSGSGNTQGTISQASIGATLVSAPSILGSVGALSTTSAPQQQFAIAIPNVNISGAALSQIGASLMASGNLKAGNKNNVIKDNTMGFVVTGIPQEALLNGQIVNITNSQLTSDLTPSHLQTPAQEEVTKPVQPVQQINVITSKQVQQKFSSMDAIRALQAGKGNLITGLPHNAVLLDGLQTGAVLQPVTLTTSTATPVMSVNNTIFSQQHHNHSAAPNQYIRSSSDGHQVATSPLPNGVVANASDKDLLLSHRHTVFQPKGISQSAIVQQARGAVQQTSHIFTGAQLHNQNFTFQTPNSAALTNQINANTNQVLPNQLTQLQVKNSGLHKASTINKMNMQPVSITIPLVTQNNLAGVEMGMSNQQHALFIRSEDPQKQGIHLQQMDQPTQNSPSSMIS